MAPRIAWVEEDEAEGQVAELYAEVRQRFGQVAPIIKTFSPHPDALAALLHLIRVHFAAGGALTRAQREMIATYTSCLQGCHY